MHVRRLADCGEMVAGDGCLLRETLSPLADAGVAARFSLARARLAPGGATAPHALASSEVYFFVSGRGVMHVGDESADVGQNDTVYVPPGSVQWLANTGQNELVFLCIVDPAWRAGDEAVLG